MTTPITQADREAAAKWAKMQGRHAQAANILRGSCDTAPLVKLFAAHRIAAERETVERIVEWLRAGAGTDIAALDATSRILFMRGLHKYADAIEQGDWRND